MDDIQGITSGTQFLSTTGRIWTVRSITPSATRVVLACEAPDGEHGAVMDMVAVLRMVRIDQPGGLRSAAVAPIEAPLPDLVQA